MSDLRDKIKTALIHFYIGGSENLEDRGDIIENKEYLNSFT